MRATAVGLHKNMRIPQIMSKICKSNSLRQANHHHVIFMEIGVRKDAGKGL